MDKLPPELRARATAMANGDTVTVGNVRVEATPAYHTVPEYMRYHPKGRDNGYLLTVAGRRIYISGDTDATREVMALRNIDLAFMAISQWTFTPERGAAAVRAIRPRVIYPYHAESASERDQFVRDALRASPGSQIIARDAN